MNLPYGNSSVTDTMLQANTKVTSNTYLSFSSKVQIDIEEKIKMPSSTSVNDEIQSLTCYNIRPLFFHGYIGPFVILYFAWFYFWVFVYGASLDVQYLVQG
jgi:hypothetical protein